MPRRPSTTAVAVLLERRTLLSTLTVIAPFAGYDGLNPVGAPVLDAAGDLFGCTSGGGGGAVYGDYSRTGVSPEGTVFEVPSDTKALTVLASFSTDMLAVGLLPSSGPTLDAAGDLFGTTSAGGAGGVGTIWELPAGSTTVVALASFAAPLDAGVYRYLCGPLTVDAAGDLFGTLVEQTTSGPGDGILFELPAGTSTVALRHQFVGSDGAGPAGPLAVGPDGSVYGTTTAGGTDGDGTVYRFDPTTGGLTTLCSFTGGADGSGPTGVTLTRAGRLAGTTAGGGADGAGTVFDLDPATSELAHLLPVTSATAGGLAAGPTGTLYAVEPSGGTGGTGAFLSVDPDTFAAVSTNAPAVAAAPDVGGVTVTYPGITALSGTTGLAVDAAGDVYGNDFVPPTGTGLDAVSHGAGTTYEYAPAAAPPADYLDIIQTPTFSTSGQPVTGVVKVAVVSAPHEIDRAGTGTVRLTCPDDDLSGTVTAPIIDGIATIAGLTVTNVDQTAGETAQYTLSATDGVDAPAAPESQPFGAASGGGAESNGLIESPDEVPSEPVVLSAVVGSTLPALLPAGRALGRRAITVRLLNLAGWPKGTTGSVAVLASPDGTTVGAVELGEVPVEMNARRAVVPITAYPPALVAGTYELFARVTDPDGAQVVSIPGPRVAKNGGSTVGLYTVPETFTVGSGQAKLRALFTGDGDANEFDPGQQPAVIGVQLQDTGTAASVGRFQVSLAVAPSNDPTPSSMLQAVRTVSARLSIRPNGGTATIRVPVGRLPGIDYAFEFVATITEPDGTVLTISTFDVP